MKKVILRTLMSTSKDDLSALQKLIESAPAYWMKVAGEVPAKNAAEETFKALPEGKNYDDKFVIGIYLDDELAGCIDVIRSFPRADTAMLGLLLISESHQRQGVGKISYLALEDLMRLWTNIKIVRIGVVRTNETVSTFWRSLGFNETGLRRPYHDGVIHSETIVLEKLLS